MTTSTENENVLKTENENLEKQKQTTGTTYLANNRETFYQNQQKDVLDHSYSFMWFLYIFLLMFYIFLTLFIDESQGLASGTISIIMYSLFPFLIWPLSEVIVSGYLNSQTDAQFINPMLNMQRVQL
jgi:hypothetical protein